MPKTDINKPCDQNFGWPIMIHLENNAMCFVERELIDKQRNSNFIFRTAIAENLNLQGPDLLVV